MNKPIPFWNQLLMRSDAIAEMKADDPEVLEQLRAQLDTLVEQYRGALDPADQFEAYVVIDLCKNMENLLGRIQSTKAPAKRSRRRTAKK